MYVSGFIVPVPADKKDAYVRQLSGGMKQRACSDCARVARIACGCQDGRVKARTRTPTIVRG